MSEFPQTAQTVPSPANLGKDPAEIPYMAEVHRLLTDESLANSGLAPHEQGIAIADRFIGMLVADGSVATGLGETMPVGQLFREVDAMGTKKTGQTFAEDLQTLPSDKGFRAAIHFLAQDERTGQLFGDFSHRIAERHGKPVLTSLIQLQGYMDRIGTRQPTSDGQSPTWGREIISQVTGYAKDKYQTNPFERQSNLGSDVDAVKRDQQRFEAASAQAIQAGADKELLTYSAAEIQRRHQVGQEIGSNMLQHVALPMNYDHMFQA